MAMNFSITAHQNPDNLHLRLDGDFDGSSAQELVDALEKRCRFSSRAFIHTSGLQQVDPFGLSLFHANLNNLKHRKICRPLLFTGNHACELARDGGEDSILP
jgi:anti-anti-sigma regulatory factor